MQNHLTIALQCSGASDMGVREETEPRSVLRLNLLCVVVRKAGLALNI